MEREFVLPQKRFFTLREACDLKGLNYKTACNQTSLQPNRGQPDVLLGGRKVFRFETVLAWIDLGDEQLRGGESQA